MSKLEEAKKLCVDNLLVPFEGYAKKLSNGDCEAYPDPASPLMKVSKRDRSLLEPSEYERLGRPWTIGYGSTWDEYGAPIMPGDVWTMERSLKVKEIALNKFLVALLAMSPGLAQENPYKIAAVLSWVYNCGMGNYRISTYKKRIDAKDWVGAAEQGMKWNKAQGKILAGLTRRRKAEADFLLK